MIESDGTPAVVSSRLRTVDDKLRAIVEQRDGGCCVPGCEQRRWLHIHHIWHWEDGRPTVTWNLCATCPPHHRMHHQGLLEIRGNADLPGDLRFYDRWGREITAIPRAPRAGPVYDDAPLFTHPSGEHVNWHWFNWQELDDTTFN